MIDRSRHHPSIARCGPLMVRLVRAAIATAVIASLGCGSLETTHTVGALGDYSCLQCHRNGDYGAPSIDHSDRRHCVSCHEVFDWRPVPHSLDTADCLFCHERAGAGGTATYHLDRDDCTRCHARSM
jgi:hypothetical protein